MVAWAPVFVTALITIIGWAVNYGTHGRAISEHDKKFEGVDREQESQWGQINATREDVGKIKGRLGINGATVAGD